MERTVFLNGEFMPEGAARLPIFDRGLLFADSVYEGFGILDSQITDFEYHMNRLDRSLDELNIPLPMTRDDMLDAMMTLIEANGLAEGFLYLQITRGTGERSYLYDDSYTPNIFAFTQPANSLPTVTPIRWRWQPYRTSAGRAAISRRPICWGR